MPSTPIVDSHLHLWDPRRMRMDWVAGNATLDQPYGPAEYRQHTAGLDIAAMVYLQVDVSPAYGLIEARWVAQLAQEEPRIQGIVAWAPLEDGERVRSYLDALMGVGRLVKGVRRLIQGETDPDFCLRPDFVRGVQLLPAYGLSFDLCINHRQLAGATKLVRQCSDTLFILDHIAKPDIQGHQLEPWREQMAALAALPNVICKISGVATEADHERWTSEDLAPYIAHALAVFGEDRVAFGGDWPVVLLAGSYHRWVDTLDALTSHLTPTAKQKLWADNARRFYRLPPA